MREHRGFYGYDLQNPAVIYPMMIQRNRNEALIVNPSMLGSSDAR